VKITRPRLFWVMLGNAVLCTAFLAGLSLFPPLSPIPREEGGLRLTYMRKGLPDPVHTAKRNVAAVRIDLGPELYDLDEMLDALRSRGAKVTFAMKHKDEEAARKIAAEGHELASTHDVQVCAVQPMSFLAVAPGPSASVALEQILEEISAAGLEPCTVSYLFSLRASPKML
jgi:hypothetical protein